MSVFSIGRRKFFGAILAAGLLGGLGAVGSGVQGAPPDKTPITIQLINVSDWHGQLDPLTVGTQSLGGAATLMTAFKQERAANPNTILFTAGDSFGATPPLSGFFEERPAVEAMNLMGFDLDGLGNHNWDRGNAHLQQMINLANFPYVSSNLNNVEANLTGVAPWFIKEVGGVKVGFVGVTNPEAPSLVFPGNFGSIEITDPVAAAQKARSELRKRGAKINVLIAHMGVTGFNASGQPIGPLIDLANGVEGFDVIAGDHTDVQYSGLINGQLVYENASKGVSFARATLMVHSVAENVKSASVVFVPALAAGACSFSPDPAMVALLAPYRTQLAAAFDGKIGVATGRFPRGGGVERSGEVAIGNIVADSMRLTYGTELALTNGGGLRAALPSSYVPQAAGLDRTDPAPYDLVIGDVYTVLPFGNEVITRTVTGAQLWAALENGVSRINPATGNGADGRFPQISGFKFAFTYTNPSGSRVSSVTLNNGTPIPNDPSATYTFATNDFVNTGGDSYAVLNDGQGVSRDLMANVLLEYIKAKGTVSPVIDGRITKNSATP